MYAFLDYEHKNQVQKPYLKLYNFGSLFSGCVLLHRDQLRQIFINLLQYIYVCIQ